MKKEEIKHRMFAVVEQTMGFRWEEVKAGDDLRLDLGVGEIEFWNLGFELEEQFGMEFEAGWFERVYTVGDVIELVKQAVE